MGEHPDAYPKEIAKEFNCCETAIRKAFAWLGITPKKKTVHYREQDPEQVKSYQKAVAGIAPEQIAYVDETGIDTYLYREYGYAPRGQKVHAAISGRKYKRVGIVAAQLGREIISPLVYSDTMNSNLFEFWFEQQLLPALPSNTVIVMDNASFHRKAQLICVAQKHRVPLIFCLLILLTSTPLSISGYGSNAIFVLLYPASTLLMMLFLMLFKCVNYTSNSRASLCSIW